MKSLKSWGWIGFALVAGYLVASMYYKQGEVVAPKSAPPANKAGEKTNPVPLPRDTSAPAGVKVKATGPLPMAARALLSGADLADHIRSGEANASPQNYVDAVALYHPEAGVTDAEGLYVYLRNLEVVGCPQGVEYRLSSVTPGGKLGALNRKFRSNEKCLMDRNTQEVVASISCGNVGSPASPVVAMTPKVVVAQLPQAQGDSLEQKIARACGGPAKFDGVKWICEKQEPASPVADRDDFFAKAVDEEAEVQEMQEASEPVPVRRQRAIYVAPPAPHCPAYIDSNGMLVPEGYRRVPGGSRVLCQ